MITTIVVDLHGGLGAFRQVRPLLYGLVAQQRLHWMEGMSMEGDRLAAALISWLRRRRISDFQVVFLVGVGHSSDPTRHGLTNQLAWIERQLVQRLRDAGCGHPMLYVLVLDSLNRDAASGEPDDPAEKPQWRLDISGIAEELPDSEHLFRRELALLRLSWPGTGVPHRDALLQLAFFLAFLAERAGDLPPLADDPDRYHEVALILDSSVIDRMYAHYAARLRATLAWLDRPRESRDPVAVRHFDATHCGRIASVPDSLDIEPLRPARFRRPVTTEGWRRWLRLGEGRVQPREQQTWERWLERVESRLDARQAELRELAEKAAEEARLPGSPPSVESVADLRAEMERRRKHYEACKSALDSSDVPQLPAAFGQQSAGLSREIEPLLENRPSAAGAITAVTAGLAICGAAFAGGFARPLPGDWPAYVPVPALLAGSALLAAIVPVALYWRELWNLSRRAVNIAKNIDRELRKLLDWQTAKAQALCRLAVAVRDLEAVEAAQAEENRTRALEAFHRREIHSHLLSAQDFAAGTADGTVEEEHSTPRLEIERPVEENPTYRPIPGNVQPASVMLHVGTRSPPFETVFLCGVADINLSSRPLQKFGAAA